MSETGHVSLQTNNGISYQKLQSLWGCESIACRIMPNTMWQSKIVKSSSPDNFPNCLFSLFSSGISQPRLITRAKMLRWSPYVDRSILKKNVQCMDWSLHLHTLGPTMKSPYFSPKKRMTQVIWSWTLAKNFWLRALMTILWSVEALRTSRMVLRRCLLASRWGGTDDPVFKLPEKHCPKSSCSGCKIRKLGSFKKELYNYIH